MVAERIEQYITPWKISNIAPLRKFETKNSGSQVGFRTKRKIGEPGEGSPGFPN